MFNPPNAFSKYLNTKKLIPVPLNTREQTGRIFLVTSREKKDITHSHALISLNPFAIAVNVSAIPPVLQLSPEMILYEAEKELARIPLHLDRPQVSQCCELKIYHASIPGKSFPFLFRYWTMLLLQLKNATNKKSKNFMVPPAELLKVFAYSVIPRPVYVISLSHTKGFDAFPVDIAGTIAPGIMIFSIRKSSVSVHHILAVKTFCASTVPFGERTKSYELGKYHAGGILPKEFISLFSVSSQALKIPLPDFAVDVLELELLDYFEEGLHVQLVVKVTSEYELNKVPLLSHTAWFNPAYFKNRFASNK